MGGLVVPGRWMVGLQTGPAPAGPDSDYLPTTNQGAIIAR